MTEQKPCVRCERPIDRYARMCVYCNWDQSEAAPPPQADSPTAYVPPADNRARNRIIGIVAFVVLIIVAFFAGTLIHGFEPSEAKAAPTKEGAPATTSRAAPAPTKANVTLVPVTDSASLAAPVETPITSAPPQAPGQDASDATALPSDEYASVAAKAKAEKAQRAAMIDPRTLRGRAYEGDETPRPVHRSRPTEAAAAAPPVMTEPFPEFRPLPEIHVFRDMDARLDLTVGPTGHVTDVQVLDPVPGATAAIVNAVQDWRFRPATVNGTPVPAKVAVTITLHANE